jgi:hypothetical protein
MLFSGLGFLLALNHSLRRLAALLPDETLRSDMRLFTTVNTTLLTTLSVFATAWTLAREFPVLPNHLQDILEVLEQTRVFLVVSLGLPPVALTMTLVWKAKEADGEEEERRTRGNIRASRHQGRPLLHEASAANADEVAHQKHVIEIYI